MYTKNLTQDLRLRLTEKDMDFLKSLAEERGSSVSECIRSIIGDYRRSIETLEMFAKINELSKRGGLSNGDTETNINNIV